MKNKNFLAMLAITLISSISNVYADSNYIHYDDFWFTVDNTTGSATVRGSYSSGRIGRNIPSSVIYQGNTYITSSIASDAFHSVTGSEISNFIIPESITDIGENLFYHNVFDTITISSPYLDFLDKENYVGADVLILDIQFYPSAYDRYYKYSRTFGAEKIITGSRVNRIPGWFAYRGSREGDPKLCTIILSDSIREIGQYAFYNCYALKSVIFGKNINTIGEHAFTGCSNLDTIVWNIKTYSDITTSHDPFSYSTTVESESLRPNIKSFTLGTDVEYIPKYLCSRMKIKTFSIPYSVTAIGNYAFYFCDSLKSIYNYSPVPLVIDSSVFKRVDKTQCTLYVPQGSVAAYQAADVWKDFTIVGSLTDFSPLLNNISIASAYLETISWQEEYEEIADILREAIVNAQNVANLLTSTVAQVSQASLNLEMALQSAQESVSIINTTLFEESKNRAITYCDSILAIEESTICVQMITDALSTLQVVSYDEETTLSENLAYIENIISTLNDNIERQHKKEQLALEKEKFLEYKEIAIDSCLNLLVDQDSETIAQLITEATSAIDGLQYDEELTYSQNQAKIDEIISRLIKDIAAQRQKEDIPSVTQPVTIHKVFYEGSMYIMKGEKIYSPQGQYINNLK